MLFADQENTNIINIDDFFESSTYRRPTKSKRTKEKKRYTEQKIQVKNELKLKAIKPLTNAQKEVFDLYSKNKNIVMHGSAGTGKTFLALFNAMQDVLSDSVYTGVYIIRSSVQSRDMGFMPGNKNEKMKVFESPYYGIFSELFGRGDAYDIYKNKGIVKFEPTAFMRGITIKDSIVIIDEAQNCSWQELKTIITRCGENTRILICGDFTQTDLLRKQDQPSGMPNLLQVSECMDSMTKVEFTQKDIVRSGLVKDFLITCENLGI